jgi:hypothetical protein
MLSNLNPRLRSSGPPAPRRTPASLAPRASHRRGRTSPFARGGGAPVRARCVGHACGRRSCPPDRAFEVRRSVGEMLDREVAFPVWRGGPSAVWAAAWTVATMSVIASSILSCCSRTSDCQVWKLIVCPIAPAIRRRGRPRSRRRNWRSRPAAIVFLGSSARTRSNVSIARRDGSVTGLSHPRGVARV